MPLRHVRRRAYWVHSGIMRRLYSWRNSHVSPFLQRPRSQCLQTRLDVKVSRIAVVSASCKRLISMVEGVDLLVIIGAILMLVGTLITEGAMTL